MGFKLLCKFPSTARDLPLLKFKIGVFRYLLGNPIYSLEEFFNLPNANVSTFLVLVHCELCTLESFTVDC